MIVVNLSGGMCSGKSTTAAAVFAKLKELGVNVELVTEAVKDMVWDDNTEALDNQILITAQQYHKLKRLEGKVDVVITDASLLNGVAYNRHYKKNDVLSNYLAVNLYRRFNNINVLLPTREKYNPTGRYGSKEDSKALGLLIKDTINLYDNNDIQMDFTRPISIPREDYADTITSYIVNYLGGK